MNSHEKSAKKVNPRERYLERNSPELFPSTSRQSVTMVKSNSARPESTTQRHDRCCPSPLVTNTQIGSHLNINNGTNDLSDLSHTGRYSSSVAKGAGTAFERVGLNGVHK